jgi:hypothetical protein
MYLQVNRTLGHPSFARQVKDAHQLIAIALTSAAKSIASAALDP